MSDDVSGAGASSDSCKDANVRLAELRAMADANGRLDTEDGPVWRVPSWSDVVWLLSLIDEADRAK
jgi:hypothetical protein